MARATRRSAIAGYLRKYPLAPRYTVGRPLPLVTADGVRLAATRLDGPADAPATVVLLHGFVNWSRTPKIHAFARLLATRVHVVVPDLRGHGRSGGRGTMGLKERFDVEAAVAAARRAAPEQPVVTVGTSLGAVAALLHAGTFGGVAGVVAISAPAYFGGDTDGVRRIEQWISRPSGRFVLARLLRTRVASVVEPFPRPDTALAAISPAFTIVVHDPDDWYFGADHARTLYHWAAPPKALWWYPGGGHGTDLLTPAFAGRVLAEIDVRLRSAGRLAGSPRGDEIGSPDEGGEQRDRTEGHACEQHAVLAEGGADDDEQRADDTGGHRDDEAGVPASGLSHGRRP